MSARHHIIVDMGHLVRDRAWEAIARETEVMLAGDLSSVEFSAALVSAMGEIAFRALAQASASTDQDTRRKLYLGLVATLHQQLLDRAEEADATVARALADETAPQRLFR